MKTTRTKKAIAITIIIIITITLAGTILLWSTQTKPTGTQAKIELEGFTWNHTTLKTLILTNQTAPWWNPTYIDSALRAIGVWNDALQTLPQNYTTQQDTPKISLVASISNTTQPNYDIYIFWTNQPLVAEDTGWYALTYSASGIAQNSTITLTVNSALGASLSGIDMQNLAVHEIGHSLGLGHSNYNGDVMYPTSLLSSPARGISNLDVYGIAAVFGWTTNSSCPNQWTSAKASYFATNN
jgi:hypothetical protein